MSLKKNSSNIINFEPKVPRPFLNPGIYKNLDIALNGSRANSPEGTNIFIELIIDVSDKSRWVSWHLKVHPKN